MKNRNKNNRALKRFGVFFFTLMALALVMPSSRAYAYDYYVFGRVYSAHKLTQGESAPTNPLSSTPADQIVAADGLYAINSLSMINVTIINAANNSPLAGKLITNDGGYFLHFSNAASSVAIKYLITDAVTGEKLMENAPAAPIAPGNNVRYMLVEGASFEIGNSIHYPTFPPNTFIFTRVGKVELPLITSGYANVATAAEEARANFLGIPHYKAAPFGGNLYLFGAFSSPYYEVNTNQVNKYCYKVFVNNAAVSDPLTKVKYTVDFNTGKVTSEAVHVGPKNVGNEQNCYTPTPMSQGANIFWSFPDLISLWHTNTQSGNKTVTVKLYDTQTGNEVALATNNQDHLTLHIDNEPVYVKIDNIKLGATDYMQALCSQITLGGGHLDINYTVHHKSGYLSGYHFSAVPNDASSVHPPSTLAQGGYAPTSTFPPTPFYGTSSTSTAASASTTFTPSHACVYMFRLSAMARTTNGYSYIYGGYDEKAFYITP